jgi:bacteriorhodopsin
LLGTNVCQGGIDGGRRFYRCPYAYVTIISTSLFLYGFTSIMPVRCDSTSIIFDRVSTLLAVVWPGYHLCWQHLL